MEQGEIFERVAREVLKILAERDLLKNGPASALPGAAAETVATATGLCCPSCAGGVQDGCSAGTREPIAGKIDHTLLKAEASEDDIRGLCEEARSFRFASVCVNPAYVPLAARLLRGSGVKVCAVTGFPLGATTSAAKAFEAREASANGADEIDMVINIGALKSGRDTAVLEDIRAVRGAARGKILKVIIETSLLTRDEKIKASRLAKEAGADFVKTSTGFAGGGATPDDIRLIRRTVGPKLGIKASGGIKDYCSASKLIEAGATRIGASASVEIAGAGGPKIGL